MKILQWNCRSFKAKLVEFSYQIRNYDIAILSETWLTCFDSVIIKGFDIIRKDRIGHRGGGVGILIKNGLKYNIRNVSDCNNSLEVCAADIYDSFSKFTVVSCYRSPNSPRISTSDWRSFFDQFQDRSIVGGDFNAHHSSRGYDRCCSVGYSLVES